MEFTVGDRHIPLCHGINGTTPAAWNGMLAPGLPALERKQ